ncbi:hypothetical protein [Mesonia sp. K7]|uniref:hypothetical protein n=1 Tax=Mesonia sp. K7 TaxID=2218606 RepID=UPI000DA996AB|nr:hypothetical protein [Mesonia sp. K7]PZD79595.1 hypothetical protein DNG35_00895 [Mesonia sp. K7]
MKKSLVTFILLSLLACNQSEKKEEKVENSNVEETQKEAFQMYQMSEMAAFMEKMYADHKRMKAEIMAGQKVDSLNFDLALLYHANMTDSSDNDEAYQQMAQAFAKYEELITQDTTPQKENFNQAVNLCIACHQQKCTGPIPRIKKLLIP